MQKIIPDRCPEFNTVANKMDSAPCSGNNCPFSIYKSSLNHLCKIVAVVRTDMVYIIQHNILYYSFGQSFTRLGTIDVR